MDEEEVNSLGVGLFQADIISEADVIHHDPVKLTHNVMKMIYGLKPGDVWQDFYEDKK